MIPILNILRLWRRMNWVMTLAIMLLIVIGVFFIHSATWLRDEEKIRLLYQRQIGWALAGLAAYFAVTALDYRRLCDGAWWFYALCLVLLVVVLLVGTRYYGARRWLDLGALVVQPSELAKLAFIIAVAGLMGQRDAECYSLKMLAAVLGLAVVPALLILKEPDLGSAMILAPITLVMLFVGGAPGKPLAALLIAAALIAAGVLAVMVVPEKLGLGPERQEKVLELTGMTGYQRERILVFFNPGRDPLGAGWNKLQSEIAVGSGGLKGKGYRQGTQNMLGFLPRTVAPTDFIFPVIAEEKGFVGSLSILGLFAALLISGMLAALAAPDKLGRLLATGIMTMIFTHVAVNVSMTVGLMPITGVPLPFLSYGGTFILSILAALGLVQSVYVRRPGG